MFKNAALLLVITALSACSSSNNTTVDNNTGNNNTLPSNDGSNAGSTLNAENYEAAITESMTLLRADYFTHYIDTIEAVSALWESPELSVISNVVHNCSDGGSVERFVTDITDTSSGIPDFKLDSELHFKQCQTSDALLDGNVIVKWRQSSPAQISSTTYTNSYELEDVTLTKQSTVYTLSGNATKTVSVAGPADSYTFEVTTSSLTENTNSIVSQLNNGTYKQTYNHVIATTDGTVHHFAEIGAATVSLGKLTLNLMQVSINPEVVYANQETQDSITHTQNIASGELNLALEDGSGVQVSALPDNDNSNVLYTLTTPEGEETKIESTWIAPAECQADPRFNYGSC